MRRCNQEEPTAGVGVRLNERQYQLQAKAALDTMYSEVVVQWRPFQGEGRSQYAPVVDIAVGPFAIRRRHEREYTDLLHSTRRLIEALVALHNENVGGTEISTDFWRLEHFNENARCFLCIEIEDSGSKKHCLGDLVNASALGRVGLLVARNEKMLRTFVRQRAYLHFLGEVGKSTLKTDNALILTAEQFDSRLATELAEYRRERAKSASV